MSRPAAALALLCATLAAGGAIVAMPLFAAFDQQHAITLNRDRLDVLRKAVQEGGRLADVAANRLVFASTSGSRAAAELQTLVTGVARAQGVSIRSVQVLSPRREGDLAVVSLDVQFQAGTTALRNIIHAVETAHPLVIIDELTVRSAGSNRGPGVETEAEVGLKVRAFATTKEAS